MIKNWLHDNPKIWQFIKFCLVGATNTLVYLAVYYLLLYVNCYYLFANIAGFIVSVFNAFVWSHKYVFESQQTSVAIVLLKTYAAYGSTTIISTALMYILVDCLDVSRYIAPILTLIVTIPLNFVLNKFWSFK